MPPLLLFPSRPQPSIVLGAGNCLPRAVDCRQAHAGARLLSGVRRWSQVVMAPLIVRLFFFFLLCCWLVFSPCLVISPVAIVLWFAGLPARKKCFSAAYDCCFTPLKVCLHVPHLGAARNWFIASKQLLSSRGYPSNRGQTSRTIQLKKCKSLHSKVISTSTLLLHPLCPPSY